MLACSRPILPGRATQEVSLARPLHNAIYCAATGLTCCDKQSQIKVPTTITSRLEHSFVPTIYVNPQEET